MSDDQMRCGIFGKLPQQPDFVCHGIDGLFADNWHRWLEAAISVSREQLGERWLDIYLTSPVWRFAIDAGICGEAGAVGIVIPSVDRVGRFFPLVLAHAITDSSWGAYLDAASWYPDAERVLLSALDEQVDYQQLTESVDALPSPAFRPLLQLERLAYGTAIPDKGTVFSEVEVAAEAGAGAVVQSLTQRAYRQLLGAHSLWWTEGSDRMGASLLLCAGLPEAGQLAAMLDGEWERWGWDRERLIQTD